MDDNRTAKQLSGDYQKASTRAVDIFCSLRDRNPFESYPKEMAYCKAMWDLTVFWGDIDSKLNLMKQRGKL